jgi:transposase
MSNTSLPQIFIDPNVEVNIILRKVYYKPDGYYQTAKQLHQAVKSMGYNINIIDVDKFLKKQVIWQKYSPRPIYIPHASYNRITIPNSIHQADLIYLTHDEIDGKVYKYCLTICDVASRYKVVCALEDRSSKNVAEAFKKIYKNSLLIWPKVLQVDNGSEFKGEVRKLMESRNVKIRIGKTKKGQCIVERFNKTLAKKIYKIQDASDQLLPPPIRSRKFVRN